MFIFKNIDIPILSPTMAAWAKRLIDPPQRRGICAHLLGHRRCIPHWGSIMPSATEPKDTIRRFYEATGEEFYDLLDELLTEDVVLRDPHLEDIQGRDRVQQYYISFHEAFSDLEFTVDDLIIGENNVTIRWTAEGTHETSFWGIEPTKNEIHLSGIDIVQLKDDQVSWVWTVYDSATLLQQLGVDLPVTPPEES